ECNPADTRRRACSPVEPAIADSSAESWSLNRAACRGDASTTSRAVARYARHRTPTPCRRSCTQVRRRDRATRAIPDLRSQSTRPCPTCRTRFPILPIQSCQNVDSASRNITRFYRVLPSSRRLLLRSTRFMDNARMRRAIPALCLLLAFHIAALIAQPPSEHLDYPAIARIRDEGLNRSQVMDHISWLSDVYGPRLTGSPAILQASDWALKKFSEWGLVNAHRETWAFGKGWTLVRFSAHMIEPQVQPLIG